MEHGQEAVGLNDDSWSWFLKATDAMYGTVGTSAQDRGKGGSGR